MLAIFLAKLRMSVEEASDEFGTIIEQVYEPDGLTPSERSNRLRHCMEEVMKKRGFSIHLKLLDETQREECAGFVVVSLCSNIQTNVCLRTYSTRSHPSSTITVIEAVLATCASRSTFSPVPIGERHRRREYVGAGYGQTIPCAR
ncbi:hypothetical protein M408DRAFT_332282 [Serendipita vermifera MAFF 305830]|uniref:Uncharacterized protein n=1 Tax=Serendipita vermifera MAFF 305830 TaxID=933852 RepID=A0A0C3AU59_SERVB|nr:hypothetical protein M408DRAFT_332282 [Serendipita vermifera MAFF 305830]